MSSVIDTNVLIVANGKSIQASIDCELESINLLESCKSLAIVLDENGLIMEEYAKHSNYKGAPGVGDMFFKYLHDNQYVPISNITLVNIHPIDDESRSFEELPSNNFDPSDRKLLAAAVASNAEVINATDSDWLEQQALMQQLHVTIRQLCPDCCNRI
jgi:predicted nucleic acid-binding protein